MFDNIAAKVYPHATMPDVIVLEWGKGFVHTQAGKDAVNAVLDAMHPQKKSYLLAFINAEGYSTDFLDWLVAEWYNSAYARGLVKIAHKLGGEMIGNIAAEVVSWEDKSGIIFGNFTNETEDEIIEWLLE